MEDRWIFLGDYVDRGSGSAQVVERLIAWRKAHPESVFLKGNHEDMMLDFLEGEIGAALLWLPNGGEETLASYGIRPPGNPRDRAELAQCQARFAAALPDSHRSFLRELPSIHRIGDFIFVHAGLNPDRDPQDQRDEDLIWIRDRFLHAVRDFGGLVVHGHSPSDDVDIRANRIGLDTGAGKGGYLTAGLFWGTERRFLHAYPA